MERGEKKIIKNLMNYIPDIFLIALTVGGMRGLVLQHEISGLLASKLIFASVLLIILFFTTIRFFQASSHKGKKEGNSIKIFVICYTISFLGVLLGTYFHVKELWMLGGFMFTMLSDSFLGLVYQILFCMLQALIQGSDLSGFILPCLVGAGLCLLVPCLKKLSNVGYVFIIGMLSNFIVIMLESDYQFEKIVSLKTLGREVLFGCMFALCISGTQYIKKKLGLEKHGHEHQETDAGNEMADTQEEQIDSENKVADIDIISEQKITKIKVAEDVDYSQFTKKDQTFLVELKQQQPLVYSHSLMVATAARGAAQILNCNAQLCYAAGLLHEIGRLEGLNYVEEGCKMLRKHNYPEEIIQIIEEHNVKGKPIFSKESAVVMLSDGVIVLCERVGNTKSVEEKKEMIRKLFALRFQQDSVLLCGFSLEEYKRLQDFYQSWVELRA